MGRSAIAPGARSLLPGTRLGKYVLLEKLARGGMAEVYLGRVVGADRFSKLVAIKLVLPHLADDERFVAMFRREAKLSAKLDHPNIAQVLDLGFADGEYFIAIEYVHGQTVGAILRKSNEHGDLPLSVGLTALASACAGLHYAHGCDLVHRDVSPANVMVRYDGTVKVLDFGIAKAAVVTKATRTGTLKGKVGYMSPEQCKGDELDRRSDVFALGILLYECTTGRRLFYGDNEFGVMNKIVDGEFDPPSAVREGYPPELEAVVMRALQCDPDARFPTAAAMQRAIEEAAAAIGERLSTLELAQHMKMLFGEPVYPSPDLEASERQTLVVAGALPVTDSIVIAKPRRRAPLLAVAGVAVVGLVAGATWLAQGSFASNTDTAPKVDAAPRNDAKGPSAPDDPGEPDDPGADEPNAEPTAMPVAEPPEPARAEDDTRSPARKKRKPRKRTNDGKPPTKKTDRNAFFPEGV